MKKLIQNSLVFLMLIPYTGYSQTAKPAVVAPASNQLIIKSKEDLQKESATFLGDKKKHDEENKNTIHPHWFKSCVFGASSDRNRNFPVSFIREEDPYIYFSLVELSGHSNPLEPQTLNFYETKDFNSQPPAYSVDKEGLKKNGKLKCSWNIPYTETQLYNMSLANCHEAEEGKFLSYNLIGDGISPGDLCRVLKIAKVERDGNGLFWVQFLIDNKMVYLDTHSMENVKNGKYIFSPELMIEKRNAEKKLRAQKNKELLLKISQHPMYQDLKKCLGSSKTDCLEKFLSKDFKISLATDGDHKICTEHYPNEEQTDFCLSNQQEAISNASKKLALDFVKLVEKGEGQYFKISNEAGIWKIQFFEGGDIETHYNRNYQIEINEKSLIFTNYFDGMAC